MIRSFLILSLFVLALSASGCHNGGAQPFGQGLGLSQGGSQNLLGTQQPILGGILQQPSNNLSGGLQPAQPSLGQIGRNLGSRFGNGLVNQGINRVINGVFSAL